MSNDGKYDEFWGDYMVRDEHGEPLYDSRFDPAMGHWTQYSADPNIDLSVFINAYKNEDSDDKNNSSSISVSKEMFSDDNIEETKKTYNHDYGRLLRTLAIFCDSESLEELLSEYNLTTKDIINPNKELFEELRQRIINCKRKGL